MFGFKFITSNTLSYLKAQNRIANEKLRDTESDLKTLQAKLANETRRGANLKTELKLYTTSIPDPKDLPLLDDIIKVVKQNDKYTDAIKLFAGIWRRYDK